MKFDQYRIQRQLVAQNLPYSRFPEFSFDDACVELDAVIRQDVKKRSAIANDKHLSAEGQRVARVRLNQETRAKVNEALQKIVGGLDKRIEVAEATIQRATSPKPITDPVLQLARDIRHSELRRKVDGLDPFHVQLLYETTEDPDFRAALESGTRLFQPKAPDGKPTGMPSLVPYVAQEVVDRVRTVVGGKVVPDVMAEKEDLTSMRDTLKGFHNAVLADLPVPAADITAADIDPAVTPEGIERAKLALAQGPAVAPVAEV